MLNRLGVAVGILMDGRGRVLVNQRPPGSHMAGYWEFPGGKIAPGEDGWQALVRELDEELGVTARYGHPLLTLSHRYPDRTVELDVWRVTEYRGVPQPREGQQLRWCAPRGLDDLKLLPADGPIVAALRQ